MSRIKKFIFTLIFALALFASAASPARAACNPPDPRTASATDNYPVNHADINPLGVRSYTSITGAHNLIDFVHEADPNAMPPQLSTLIEGNASPAIGSLNQVCMWNWSGDTGQGSRGGPIERPSDVPSDFATLVGLGTSAGQAILVPRSGYDIGGGRTAMVLYATANSITLKYTAEDDMIAGYGIHLSNFNVDQKLLDYYNTLNNQGRNELPVLCSGFKLGVAIGGEIQVAIRDTGSFMDPRWRDPGGKNDWWQITTPATAATQCELTSTKVEQTVTRASKIGVDGPLYGRDPYDRLKVRENAAVQAQLAQKVSRYDIVPYCPAMGVNQPDVNPTTMSLDQYKYCTKDESRFAVEGRGFISCPDYSPNRPYPGDTCINYTDIKTTNVTTFSQPVFETGGSMTYDLCRKEKSSIPGVPASFPCLPQKYTVIVPQKKQVTYDKAFVEYLGTNNEYTSDPNAIMSLKNNIARTSQYLTDYLGGFAHAPGVRDRSRAMAEFLRAIYDLKLIIDNPSSTSAQKDAAYQTFQATLAKIENLKEILQLTSGAMAKLSPQKWAEVQFDSNKVLLSRWLVSNLPSTDGEKPKDKVEKTPIGDYVVAWTCPETVNEEEFPDSLDRTQATIKTKGKTKDCKNPHPIRISEFICGNANAWADAEATFGLLADEICRGKKTGSSEGEAQIVYWPNFMPLTTREDTPVRVQISCESSKDEKGKPPSYPKAGEILDEKKLREFMISQNTPDADTYYIDNPHKTPGNPYLVISRKFIYIGHLAEARELSYYTGSMLLPKAMQDTVLKNPKMDELDPAIAAGDVKTAAAQTGDLIAEDAKLRYFKDSDKVQVVTAVNKDHGLPPTWGGIGAVPTGAAELKNKCTIQVEMPYIAEVAARTIGKDAGFMRLFLPETVGDDLSKNIRSQGNKGAGVALSSYASEHDFIKFVDESGNEIWTAAGEPGVDRAEGRIYIPWVKEMQAFQTVALGYGLNPARVQAGRDVIIPGTGTTVNAAWQQCMTKDVDFKNTSFSDVAIAAAFARRWPFIKGGTYGTNYLSQKDQNEALQIWVEMGKIARDGGINPILALAYWGEETHYSSNDDNPKLNMAIGCGAPPGGTSCVKTYNNISDKNMRELSQLTDEFKCIAASNPPGGSCNLSEACRGETDTLGFMGCYHNGAGKPPGDNHLGNVMTFYYQMLGTSVPDCSQYK